MQRLLETNTVVPADNENRNFRYLHQETGHWSESSIYSDGDTGGLIEKYLAHRKSNGLPIPEDYEAVVQDQMCQTLPPEWCKRQKGQSWVSTRFSSEDFLDGMKAFGRLMLGGFNFVTQAEADRRARICANCYYNVDLPGCTSCRKVASYLTGDVALKKTAYDEKLKACAVCKCSIQAMIWFPMDILEANDTPEKQALYPIEFCWKSKASPNYIPA